MDVVIMDSKFVQNIKILSSQTDSNAQVGILNALSLLQDNMCESFKALNCDGIAMIPTHHCFWAMTKTKIRFDKPLKWLDYSTLDTEICTLSSIRMNMRNNILLPDGSIAIAGKQEMCAMDFDTRKLRLISTTALPKDLDVGMDNTGLAFSKYTDEVSDIDYVYDTRVSCENVDYFGHTNNVMYARFMIQALSLDFLKSTSVKEFEIHYLSESKEGDILKIYKKESDGRIYFEIRKGTRPICCGSMIY